MVVGNPRGEISVLKEHGKAEVVSSVLLVLAALGCVNEALACENDNDCKGDRVCYEGNCVDPEASRAPQAGPAAQTPTAPAPLADEPSPAYGPPQPPVTPQAAPPPAAVVGNVPPPLTGAQGMISVTVTSSKVPEADVYVDGQLVGQAPWQGAVLAGEHVVKVVPKNAYGAREKKTKVWPLRTRLLEFGSFLSSDQDTWTEWLGLRGYGGFSLHQWYNDGNMNDPQESCPGGSEFDSDYDTASPNCDYVVNNARGPFGWYMMQVPTFLAGGELSLFTVRWTHFYWEIFNGGGAWPMGGFWGTAFGLPLHFGKSEIRIGAHLTLWDGFYPTPSGLELYWVRHLARHFALEIGLKQFSFPFAIGLALGFRI